MDSTDRLVVKTSFFVMVLFFVLMAFGVTPNANAQASVKRCIVVGSEKWTKEVDATPLARGTGGALGGLLGAALAVSGNNNAVTTALVSGVTGVIGERIANNANKTTVTVEMLILELQDGSLVSVKQEVNQPLAINDPCYLVGGERVIKK